MLFCVIFTHFNIVSAKIVYHGAPSIATRIPNSRNFYRDVQKKPGILYIVPKLKHFYRYFLSILQYANH